jgi:hypothetical protein
MAITSALCTSFKVELGQALHNFTASTGNTFKLALYTSSATLSASTTAYSSTNEITNTAGTAYTAGGVTLTSVTPVASSTTAVFDFADPSWTSASFTARGCLIYNSSASNRAVMVNDFGADKTVSSGAFTLTMPTPDSANAVIRLA